MRIALFLFFLVTYLSLAQSAEFSTLSLKNWKKEELAHDHLRFTNSQKKEIVIHLQVDSYDKEHFWNEKTLARDIADMARLRKGMSFFLGTADYQIETYKLETKTSRPELSLTGSYKRIDGLLIRFAEINFYYQEHFLQLKIVSEGKLPSNKELEEIIKEINPSSLAMD